jgi:hypothetical protein
MFSAIIDIFKNLTAIIKNLNLTREQTIIALCVFALAGSLWAVSHYKGEANKFEIDLLSTQKELFIERNNPTIDTNIKEKKQLQSELNNKNKELVMLYKKYNDLLSSGITYTEAMEGLGDINNTQDICDAWVRLGFYICDE